MLASFDQRSLPFGFRGQLMSSSARHRAVRTLAALAIAGALLGGAAASAPRAALAARLASGADVALMAGPGADYGVLTTIPVGSSLKVEGDASDGFMPVSFNGVSGWVPAGVVDNSDDGGGVDVANGNGNGNGDGGGNGGKGNGGGKGGGGNGGDGGTDASSVSSDNAPATVNGAPADDASGSAAPSGDDASGAAAPASGDGSGSAAPSTGDGSGTDAPAASPGYNGSLDPPANGQYSQDQIVGIITDAANQYGQSPDAMIRVARCESGLNPNDVGGGQYYGLFQFVPSTFAKTPYGDQNIFDPSANAGAAAWMWSQGNKGAWSCQ
jgi:transglycosylase-like protein with SLT domain/SH3 domain-containing protein